MILLEGCVSAAVEAADLVESSDDVIRQSNLDRGQGGIQLLGLTGADDRGRYGWLAESPRDGQRRQGDSEFRGYAASLVHRVKRVLVPVQLIRELVQSESGVRGWRLVRIMLA